MMPIGSVVLYCGKLWVNGIRGIQPVWGVKKKKATDEVSHSNVGALQQKKSFQEFLDEKLECGSGE